MSGSLIAIVLLLAANAFFVAVEFALVKVRHFQLEEAVKQEKRFAPLTLKIHQKLDAYLAACQLGITMSSLGLGWVGEPAVAALLEPLLASIGISGQSLHTISFILGFLFFSSLHIVIGEQVPKTYAIRKPEPVSLWLAYPLEIFYRISYPLNWLLDRANAFILGLMGIKGGSHHEVISESEFSAILDDSEAHGEIEQKTADIIRRAFDFDDMRVQAIMLPWDQVDSLKLSDSLTEIKAIMADTLHSRFPVLDDAGNAVGILTTKDLTKSILLSEDFQDIEKLLREPIFTPSFLLISKLFDTMRASRQHLSIVIDEYGNNIGIITMEDMLEEIVGEIDDEWDEQEGEADEDTLDAPKTEWELMGSLDLTEVSEELGCELTSEHYHTLGGLLLEQFGRVPVENDSLAYEGFEFIVLDISENHIGKVQVTKIDPALEPTKPESDANASKAGDADSNHATKPMDDTQDK